jgi:hypothetical protein
MAKNYMPEVAKMLGVGIEEEFRLLSFDDYKYKFTNEGLLECHISNNDWYDNENNVLNLLLVGDCIVIKQPQLTPAEKTVLENLPKEFNWVARDEDNMLSLYGSKPKKKNNQWDGEKFALLNIFNHLFQFIKWENEEPYSIKELLGRCKVMKYIYKNHINVSLYSDLRPRCIKVSYLYK